MATALASAGGWRLPVVLPVAAGLGLAFLAALLAHRDVLARATRARREFARAVCTYLDLVALQLAAAHGPVQALEQAAAVCDGWVFERIRDSLRIAQLQMHAPWAELRELAEEIGVPELGDVGAIMQSLRHARARRSTRRCGSAPTRCATRSAPTTWPAPRRSPAGSTFPARCWSSSSSASSSIHSSPGSDS